MLHEEKEKLVADSAPHAETAHPGDAPMPGMPRISIKYFVLLLLTLQNVGAVLMMRWVRAKPGEGLFVTQTAVVMQERPRVLAKLGHSSHFAWQELFKGLVCGAIMIRSDGTLHEAYAVPSEALKTGIPALLYLVQNNLQYMAISYLDAATYTVTYQSKILWSGLLSTILLNRILGVQRWVALFMICIGVSVVQLSGVTSHQAASVASERILGLFLILAAAMFSSLAGVAFEMFLKGVKISLWARNFQLAFYSFWIGIAVCVTSRDGADVVKKGWFYGYTPMTWVAIGLNSLGGLLVGMVLKYADAVLKDIALGLSIIMSSLLSALLFNFEITLLFLFGMAMVIYAAVLYGGRADCCGYFAV